MKTLLFSVLAVGLLFAGGAAGADDQPDAKTLLDKAIKAMGGQAKLANLNTVSAKAKITGSPGGQEITVDIDGLWQGMNQYRADANVQEGGNNFRGVLVFNGDKGWIKKGDNTKDAPDGVVPFIQNIFYAGRMPQLLPALKDKAYTLAPLGEVKVGTQAAVGLSIRHSDRKDVSLFFDKQSGLPLKSEVRLADPKGKEITVEFHYSDYKDFDGVKLSSKVMIKVDDAEFNMELSDIKGVEKVDASQFDRP
jgi:outer membrane lipoprotein-sorting protein